MLARFVTTVVEKPTSFAQRVACCMAGLIGFDLAREFRRRAIPDLPPERILKYPWRELIRLGIGRIDRSGVLQDRVWEWAEIGFDSWVARNALQNTSAVYGYEHACRFSLEEGRRRGLFCIYELPAPEHQFTHGILCRETDRFPELLNSYQKRIRQPELHHRRTERRRCEWQAADLIIVNSNFTRNSFAGYEDPAQPSKGLDKVCVVPLGAPEPDPAGVDGGSRGSGPVRFLWAGTFSIGKGAHYLIEAWKKVGLNSRLARLDVYGAVTLPSAVLSQAPSEFQFHGSIPRDELYTVYRQADILVFPTLYDGFGMVVTEAFSRGLPVLTSCNAGAADLIREGINGLIVPPADADALAASLQWCLDHQPILRAMRPEALATAARWQWSDYRTALLATVLDRFDRVRS